MKVPAYRKHRNEYSYEDELICPCCDEIIEDAYEYFEDSTEEVEIECTHCEKKFLANWDDHKYNSRVIPCSGDNHDWARQKGTHTSSWGWSKGMETSVYYCGDCSEMKFVPIRANGNEYTRKEIAKMEKLEEKKQRREDNKKDYPCKGEKTGDYRLHDTSFLIGTEEAYGNRRLFLNIIIELRKIGFNVMHDEDIKKNYSSLNKTHRYGVWKGLEFSAEYYNTGMKFEFFQNIVPTRDRKIGDGKYGFDKFKYMPYLTKQRFKFAINTIKKYLEDNYGIVERVVEKLDWHGRPELDAYKTKREKVAAIRTTNDVVDSYNSKDRDEKIMKNGDRKYFYSSRTNRLSVGNVYHNINNMWWVITGEETYDNVASFHLFDFTKESPRRKPVEVEEVLNKLKNKLNYLVEKSDFEACIKVRDSIKIFENRINKDVVAAV